MNLIRPQRSANQNHNEVSLHTYLDGSHKKTVTSTGERECRESERSHIDGGSVKWCIHVEKWSSLPQKVRQLPYDVAFNSKVYTQENGNLCFLPHKMCTRMFTAACEPKRANNPNSHQVIRR